MIADLDEHCWHPDSDSTESYDPWPARTGRQGVRCCSCPAYGHRPVTLTESKYEGFHTAIVPLYGETTQTNGPALCTGVDMREEKHAVWIANGIGYTVLVGVLVAAAWFLPSTIVELSRVPGIWWVLGFVLVSSMLQGFLAHGHKELRRVNAELAKNRALTVVALPQAPRFIVACPECKVPEAVMDTRQNMAAWRAADRWMYTGVVCCGCGRSFTVQAIDNEAGGPRRIKAVRGFDRGSTKQASASQPD